MSIYLEESTYSLTSLTRGELGKLLNQRPRLRRHLQQMLRQPTTSGPFNTPSNIQDYVDLYAEQVTTDPRADLIKYFQIKGNRGLSGLTVQGLPTQFPPLSIGPKDLKPSNTAIACLAEGLTGWYMELRHMVPLARPVGMDFDFVFRDSGHTQYALVETKGTQEKYIETRLLETLPPLLQYIFNELPNGVKPHYTCIALGVIIEENIPVENFRLLSLRIDIT